MRLPTLLISIVGLGHALCACGDNVKVPDARLFDAALDAPADAPPDGPCGTNRFITGEVVDIDSTEVDFMGVNDAMFTLRGATATDATSPNGRFEMCAPQLLTYVFDVDMPADRVDGIAYVEPEALSGTDAATISFRSFTETRIASFFTERSLTYDDTRAQVLVFLAGETISNLTFDRMHDTPQGATETNGVLTWSTTMVGRHVLFPNVAVDNPTGTLVGDPSGAHTIPLEAGKITYVALYWVF